MNIILNEILSKIKISELCQPHFSLELNLIGFESTYNNAFKLNICK